MDGIVGLFEIRNDGRSKNKRYSSGLVVAMMVVGLLSGRTSVIGAYRMMQAMDLRELAAFGIRSRGFLPKMVQFFNILNGIADDDLEEMLNRFVIKTEDNRGIAQLCIDGKRLRASRVGTARGVHLIEAFVEEIRRTAAQEVMAEGEDEVAAAMRLLARLALKNTVVTADAIYTKPNMIAQITAPGADFVLAVKDNNKPLKRRMEAAFAAEDANVEGKKKRGGAGDAQRDAPSGAGRKRSRTR